MSRTLTRVGCSVVCYFATVGLAAPLAACTLANPVEYMLAAVVLAERFWFASLFLCGLMLFLDMYDKRLSLVLPITGLVVLALALLVYQHTAWHGSGIGYAPDCTVPLVEVSQYALGLVSALFAYRVFQAAQPN